MRLSFPPLKSFAVLWAVLFLTAASAWAAPATKLAISGVPGIVYTGGNAGTVTVSVESSNGAVVTTSTAQITLALVGPGGFSQSVAANAVQGVATLNASIWALANGAYTLTASSTGLTAATASLTVLPSSAVLPPTAVGSSSAAQNITFGFATATNVTGVQVLFLGAPNLDFTAGSGATCVGNHSAGTTCMVPVIFSPKAMGSRRGAVELTGAGGAILQTIYVSGVGQGSGVNFAPSQQAMIGSGLGYPDAMVFDANGNLYISDYPADDSAGRVVKLPLVGGVLNTAQQTNFGTGLNYSDGLAFDGAGNLFVSDYDENEIIEVPAGAPADGSGNIVLLANPGGGSDTSFIYNPAGMTVDGAGNLYFCDYSNNRVVEIPNQNGHLNSAAAIYLGSGLLAPSGIKVDAAGNLLVADWGNARIVDIPLENGAYNSNDQTTIITDLVGQPADLALDAAGNLYIVLEEGNALEVVPNQNGSYDPASSYMLATGLNGPDSVVIDNAGNIYFCDTYNGLAYRLDTVDPPALTFPDTPVGQTSAAQSEPVLSIGNQALSLSSITFGSNFPNQGSTCTGTLNPGLTCNLVTGFAPSALGTASQAAVLTDNAVNQALPTQTVAMTGSGLQGSQTVVITSPTTAVYGDAPLTLTATGGASGNPITFALVSGPATLAGSVLTINGAGTIVVAANQAASALYAAGQATATITVAPALLTVTANNASMAFGATVPALGYTVTGFVHGDTAAVVSGAPALATTATSSSPAGSYPITATFGTLSAANYNFVFVSGTLTVTATAPVTSWTPGTSPITYGSELGAAVLDATSSIPGIWVYSNGHVPVNAASVLPAGTYTITAVLTPNDTADYSKATLTQSITIQPAVLNLAAGNATGTFGAAIPSLTAYSITGFVHGDTQSVVTGSPALTTTATSSSPAGSYPINVATAGMSAANYTFTSTPGTLTIGPAVPATSWVPAISTTLTYGQTLNGLLDATSPVAGTWSYYINGSVETNSATVGYGTWTIDAYFDATDSKDYSEAHLSLTFTVANSTVYVTAVSATMMAGGPVPALTYTTSGWRAGDGPGSAQGAPVLTTTASSTAPVGTYPISVSVAGMSAPNYTFVGVPGTITITAATPVVSLSAAAVGLVYGQPLGNGLVTSSSVTGAWSFTANGTPVSAATILGAGSYTIVGIFTPSSTNYTQTTRNLPGTLTVTPASLTVTANDATMTAGGSVPSLGYTLAGFVGSDTAASATSGSAAVSTTATASSPAGTYPITVAAGSLSAANYTFAFVNGTLTVTAGSSLPYTTNTTVSHDFNQNKIGRGTTIWFNGRFDASGVNDGTVIAFQNGVITFTVNRQTVTITVPNSVITFSAAATQVSTSFDAATQTWRTVAPLPRAGDPQQSHHGYDHGLNWGGYGSGRYYNWGYDGQADYGSLFLDGVAYAVSGALPGNIQDVTWSGTIASNDSDAVVHWDWSAASYSSWNANYSALGVIGAASTPSGRNRSVDLAGTPENFQRYLIENLTSGGNNDNGLDNGWSYTCGDRIHFPPPPPPPPANNNHGGSTSGSGGQGNSSQSINSLVCVLAQLLSSILGSW